MLTELLRLGASLERFDRRAAMQQPKSSETHLIWVIFNRDLGGTGLTTSYTDSNFPDGYLVIYLNPDYSEMDDFWASLSAHEFAHAIHYAYRDYRIDGEEPWYWRPPLNGNPNRPPENNAYGYQSIYYAKSPCCGPMESAHQYGMVVVNAAIEEHIAGQGSLKAVWEASEGQGNRMGPIHCGGHWSGHRGDLASSPKRCST